MVLSRKCCWYLSRNKYLKCLKMRNLLFPKASVWARRRMWGKRRRIRKIHGCWKVFIRAGEWESSRHRDAGSSLPLSADWASLMSSIPNNEGWQNMPPKWCHFGKALFWGTGVQKQQVQRKGSELFFFKRWTCFYLFSFFCRNPDHQRREQIVG